MTGAVSFTFSTIIVMNVQEAVDAPRFHQQWLPDVTNVETFALSPDTRKILTDMQDTAREQGIAYEPDRPDNIHRLNMSSTMDRVCRTRSRTASSIRSYRAGKAGPGWD